MSIAVRFAPSPTGLLHIGNARTALITWLFARKQGGTFMLRIDDTDTERSKEEYVEAIKDGLHKLGLDWDCFARQSARTENYARAIKNLKDTGRLYPCYETEDELALKRKSLLSRGLPPVYDRSALQLTDEQKAKYEAEGRKPHWRFKLDHKPIVWDDLVRGRVEFNGKDLSDPVLIREDGTPLYHICSVLDDIDFGITHIMRGEDHVSNTACHIQMFEALDSTPPSFAHFSLLGDKDGGKLSKRKGALSLTHFLEDEGLEPMAIVSLLARLGTSDPIEPMMTLQNAIDSFDFKKFSRNIAKLDDEEFVRLNAKILHATDFSAIKDHLKEIGLDGADEHFWHAVRPNIERLNDVKEWWDITHGKVKPVIEDADFTAAAAALLPAEPWDQTTWKQWTDAIKDQTGRKGKNLFMPLRLALTGQQHGPELGALLPLLGHDRAVRRLKAA